MIFYFTGTGNSKYIADKLAACLDQKTIDMGKSLNDNVFTYDCSNESYIGFVFPTYGWSVPGIVKEFIVNMELDNIPDDAYVFAVNNCGNSEGRVLYDLNKLLMDKNIKLNYCRSLVFPDNYIVMFNPIEEEEKNSVLRSANIRLANVINNILRRKNSLYIKKGIMLLPYKLINIIFTKLLNGTSKFAVKDNCTGCGLCSQICNSKAIEMQNNKPVWIKKTCVHCLACLNRCPAEAIEYGAKTEGKARYINPLAKFDNSVTAYAAAAKQSDDVETDEDISEQAIDNAAAYDTELEDIDNTSDILAEEYK